MILKAIKENEKVSASPRYAGMIPSFSKSSSAA